MLLTASDELLLLLIRVCLLHWDEYGSIDSDIGPCNTHPRRELDRLAFLLGLGDDLSKVKYADLLR